MYGPLFVAKSTITGTVYLESFLTPQLDDEMATFLLLQQDGTLPLLLRHARNFLTNITLWRHYLLAAKVTGLNISGFRRWGFIEEIVVHLPPIPNSGELLKIRMSQAILLMDEEMLGRTLAEFTYRWDICAVTKGAHIENLLNHFK